MIQALLDESFLWFSRESVTCVCYFLSLDRLSRFAHPLDSAPRLIMVELGLSLNGGKRCPVPSHSHNEREKTAVAQGLERSFLCLVPGGYSKRERKQPVSRLGTKREGQIFNAVPTPCSGLLSTRNREKETRSYWRNHKCL